ncbi:hypothetical protein Poli38472_007078 [Pythium oligandrum]|uniref:Uncharacterized protein n=1 Tax=Pythium oligandrum TaxID=41045 RepID=A0A8K1FHN0_PYTOL|nr:hypothetical protein Poli38472_007078 [Pythium oligandrum]|eukprot:TMW58933.1 hypothetical protein Poli38472_007078 [Pythium oligandrum]
MVLNFIHSAFQVALLVAASEIIGVFPVPFSTTLIMPIYAAFCWITRLYVARKQLWDKADVAKALQYRTKLLKLFHMITFIIQSMTAYAVFATIFSHIPAAYQLLMAICLQFLKAWIRNKLWVKAQIHDSGGDLAAIHVATNCSFFHSIFTATCMQTSKSVYTLVFLIMWGVVKDILAFQAIRHRMNEVDRLQCTVSRLSRGSLDTRKARTQLLQRIVPSVLPPRTKSAGALPSLAVESAYIPLRVMAARLRASSSDLNPIKELTPVEIEYLDRLTQLYHCREVLLWRMFTSLFVPCFYFITALAIHQLPSAPYVGFIGMANIHVLSQRIGSQLAVRAVIGLIYGRILRRSGHLRAMDQCLFILEHQFVPLQTGCIIIALGVFAFSVTHYGNDTTFQFEWLKHHAVNTTTSLPATDFQAQVHLPQFYYPPGKAVLLNLVHSAFQIVLLIATAEIIDVFPVPFSTTLIMPVYAAFSWITRLYVAWKEVWDPHDPAKAVQYRAKLFQDFQMITSVIHSMNAYAVFAAIFSRIPAAYQFLMAICLQFLPQGLDPQQALGQGTNP